MNINVDIGNSTIKVACMNGFNIIEKTNIDYHNEDVSCKQSFSKFFDSLIFNKIISNAEEISAVNICSVVPKIADKIIDVCKEVFNCEPFIISYKKNNGIKLDLDFPEKVGNDRICDSAYAEYKYSCPCLVVDIGTAIVINVVKDKSLMGGIILPGLQASVKALTANAEQLNDVDITIPKSFIGKNTQECINLGVVFSAAGAINSAAKKICEQYNENFKLIITGFSSKYVLPFLDYEYEFEENLTLKGIEYIWSLNNTGGINETVQ